MLGIHFFSCSIISIFRGGLSAGEREREREREGGSAEEDSVPMGPTPPSHGGVKRKRPSNAWSEGRLPTNSVYRHLQPEEVAKLGLVFSRGNELIGCDAWVWVRNHVYNGWTLVKVEHWYAQCWKIPICHLADGRRSSAMATECLKQGGRVEQAVVKAQRMWKKYWQSRATHALEVFGVMVATKSSGRGCAKEVRL
jgi:hypothetical protein